MSTQSKIPSFRELIDRVNPDAYKGKLVTLDPGETTGYCVMDNLRIVEAGQLITSDLTLGTEELNLLFTKHDNIDGDDDDVPDTDDGVHVVCEDYKVYSWKTEQHNWAGLHTPKLIGVVHCLCIIHGYSLTMEMAVEAKQFVTNDKLEAWNMDLPGKRHARDAIRHALYYLLFKSGKNGNP